VYVKMKINKKRAQQIMDSNLDKCTYYLFLNIFFWLDKEVLGLKVFFQDKVTKLPIEDNAQLASHYCCQESSLKLCRNRIVLK